MDQYVGVILLVLDIFFTQILILIKIILQTLKPLHCLAAFCWGFGLQCAERPPGGKYSATVISLSLSLSVSLAQRRCGFSQSQKRAYVNQADSWVVCHFSQSSLFHVLKFAAYFDLFFVNMDSAFDNLDAAGFLEIWQHFDADGENSQWHVHIFSH